MVIREDNWCKSLVKILPMMSESIARHSRTASGASCLDSAMAERFCAAVKAEVIDERPHACGRGTQPCEYIEIFYSGTLWDPAGWSLQSTTKLQGKTYERYFAAGHCRSQRHNSASSPQSHKVPIVGSTSIRHWPTYPLTALRSGGGGGAAIRRPAGPRSPLSPRSLRRDQGVAHPAFAVAFYRVLTRN